MERTDFLDLYKLANGDYANHWEVPTNANAQAIDDHASNLADELLTAPGTAAPYYSGQLARTAGSLEARLDAAMNGNGNIIYNSGDLDKSCNQMDGFETTAIHGRLANMDRREFVNARLRYLLENTASATTGEFIKKRDVYTGPTGVELNRYVSEMGISLDTCLFDILMEVEDPTQAAGVLSVNKLGWCSIAGQLYYHSNVSYYSMAATPETIYSIVLTQEPIAVAPECIDSRMIRKYDSTGCGNGATSGSTFTATNIGLASFTTENNNWQPEAFQILRIEIAAGVYHEYLIKQVTGPDTLEIYGEFPYDPALAGKHWWVLDYTMPCVNIIAYAAPSAANRALLLTSFRNHSAHLLAAYWVSYNPVGPTFLATKNGTGFTKQHYASPSVQFIDCSDRVFAAYKSSKSLNSNAFNTNIRSIKILCMEVNQAAHGGGWDTNFIFGINPHKLVTIGALEYPIPSIYAQIKRTIYRTAALVNPDLDTWASYCDGGATTELEFICAQHFAAGTPWFEGGSANDRWWGVLIEYA
jgi:hypothetical protein